MMQKKVEHYLLFGILTLLILVKCYLFEAFCTLPSSAHPSGWIVSSALLAKLSVSLFCAASVLLFRYRTSTVLWCLVLDAWMLANMVYYRANGLYLTYDAVRMATNMQGFEGSLSAYLSWKMVLFPLLTVGFAVLMLRHKPVRNSKRWLAMCACALSLSAGASILRWGNYRENPLNTAYFNPFITPKECYPPSWEMEKLEFQYVQQHSIITYSINAVVTGVERVRLRREGADISLTAQEETLLEAIYHPTAQVMFAPKGHFVLIVVESLESWVFAMCDTDGNAVTPRLNQWRATHKMLYADKVGCQVRHGVSSDGQMMLNTGLLPLIEGAASVLYGANVYPNYASLYPNSVLINSCPGTWNKSIMARSQGYRDMVEPHSADMGFWQDDEIFGALRQACEQAEMPTCFMGLTYSTHSPFRWVESNLRLPDDMGGLMRDYLQSMHYADSCLGAFLLWADTAACMQDAVLAITGDHTFFRYAMIQEIQPYGVKYDLPFQSGITYCPLMISSPNHVEERNITTPCYQMDIYPTILHAIGVQNPVWEGFGCNLYEDECVRHCSPEEALVLSDKLIRMNYFNEGNGHKYKVQIEMQILGSVFWQDAVLD